MRIVNSSKQFSGTVVVYGKEIFINTSNGEGFSNIFNEMKSFIDKLSYKYSNGLGGFDEARQEIYISIFEGILKYKPEMKASFSTFLNVFVMHRMMDKVRKMKSVCKYDVMNFHEEVQDIDPCDKIELEQRLEGWDGRWKNIIFRLFVFGDKVSDVAREEGMSPWGLTRAIRRKFNEARKI